MMVINGFCNVTGCHREVRHDKLFCFEHWRKLPDGMQLSIVEYYTIGQDRGDAVASPTWLSVVNEAISYLDRLARIITR